MKNTANLGFFAVHKIISLYAGSIKQIRRIHGNYLSAYGEYRTPQKSCHILRLRQETKRHENKADPVLTSFRPKPKIF